MAVAIDFGNVAGVNMQKPAALGQRVLADFTGFDYRTGDFNQPLGRLEIPSTNDPAAFVLAYGAWAFNDNRTPTDNSTVFAIDVRGPDGYRIAVLTPLP